MLEYLLTHHRWIFVCLFLLPISAVYKVFFYVRNKIVFWLASAPKLHSKRVRAIQQQVRIRSRSAEQLGTYMCTGRPGWLTTCIKVGRYKDTYQKIDINLCDILSINEDRQVVHVEPLVTMGQLSSALNPLGWTLPVVPELDDLTVGMCSVHVLTSCDLTVGMCSVHVLILCEYCYSSQYVMITSHCSINSSSCTVV